MRYPPKLNSGATIGLICPGSGISSQNLLKCQAALTHMGFMVKAADNLTWDYGGYMAGPEKVRALWLHTMFADSTVQAIFCVRGGYGSSRIIEHLDAALIKAHPKIFVGYSDITCLHLFLNQCCDLATYHGPMVAPDMAQEFDPLTSANFFETINNRSSFFFENPPNAPLKILYPGQAEGVLTGGNLSVLCASLGTPNEVNTRGKILFLEDVGETPGRIDRMLFQLKAAGKFQDCTGVLLGQFTDCCSAGSSCFSYLDIFKDALNTLSIPVIYNLQVGHTCPNFTLPLGFHCWINTTTPTILFNCK